LKIRHARAFSGSSAATIAGISHVSQSNASQSVRYVSSSTNMQQAFWLGP
jgi:hypothetical protein